MAIAALQVVPCQPQEFCSADTGEGLDGKTHRNVGRSRGEKSAQLSRREDLNIIACRRSPFNSREEVCVRREPASRLTNAKKRPQYRELVVEIARMQLESFQIVGHVLRDEIAH